MSRSVRRIVQKVKVRLPGLRKTRSGMPVSAGRNYLRREPMQEFLRSCRYFFGYAFFFSMFVNVLQLTFSIYMLQVYDKVLTSYNLSTLAVITIAAVCLLYTSDAADE